MLLSTYLYKEWNHPPHRQNQRQPCLPTGMTFFKAWRDSAPTCDWKHISYKLVPYRKYVPRPKKKRVFPFPFAQNNLLRIIITPREKTVKNCFWYSKDLAGPKCTSKVTKLYFNLRFYRLIFRYGVISILYLSPIFNTTRLLKKGVSISIELAILNYNIMVNGRWKFQW